MAVTSSTVDAMVGLGALHTSPQSQEEQRFSRLSGLFELYLAFARIVIPAMAKRLKWFLADG